MKNIFHKPIFLLAMYVVLTMTVFGGEGQCPRHNQGGGLTENKGLNHTERDCPDQSDSGDDTSEGFALGGLDISSIDDYIGKYLKSIFHF